MLVKLANPDTAADVFIVNVNADAPSNFAEYRVGLDTLDPDTGARVLTGRRTGSAPGSLNFAYVNDSSWITNSGVMNVDACIIAYGDKMKSMTGVMYYSFGNMKLLPRNNADIEAFVGENCTSEVTSIKDELAGSNINFYPNPATSELNVRFDLTRSVGGNITIQDLQGRNLLSRSFQGSKGSLSLNTSALSPGYYIARMVVGNETIAIRKIAIIK